MDRITEEQRSHNMALIKSKNTKPEMFFRKLLFAQGYRYSLHSKNIPGHPDLYMKKYNTAVFINGCFWHRHSNCRYAYMPKSRTEFWTEKFRKNTERDIKIRTQLRKSSIRILTVWECTIREMIKSEEKRELILKKVEDFLCSECRELEL